MMHVIWLCHRACRFYRNELSPRQMRILLIAALFHDFNHSGRPHPEEEDPDAVNIKKAVAALRRYVMPADRALLPSIEAAIEATHFPHQTDSGELDLVGKIVRDADLAQALSTAWIQQIVFGLAQEWKVKPLAVLRAQTSFLTNLSFNTRWARQLFPQEVISAKIDEAQKLLCLLEAELRIAA